MDDFIFERIINECQIAYARCEMVYSEDKPIDYRYLEANQAFYNLLRTSESELIGQSMKSLKHKDPKEVEGFIEQIFEVSKKDLKEFNYYHKQFEQTFKVNIIGHKGNEFVLVAEQCEPFEDAYKHLQEEHHLIMNSIAEGIMVVSQEHKVVSLNQSALSILGYISESSVIGVNIFNLLFAHLKNIIRSKFNALLNRVPFYNQTTKFIKSDGTWIDVTFSVTRRTKGNATIGYVMSFQDVSKEKELENQLKISEDIKSIALNHLPGLIYQSLPDESRTITFVSHGVYELTGYTKLEMENEAPFNYSRIVHQDYQQEIWSDWQNSIQTGNEFEKEYMIVTKEGKTKWVYEKGKPIYNQSNEVVAIEGIIIDLDKRRQKDIEIEHLMYHDRLSGLKNRLYFDHMLNKYVEEARYPIGIMVADLDGMKFINDVFGRQFGDKVIEEFADILKKHEKNGVVVARSGGDEFSLILPHSEASNTYEVMINIQEDAKQFIYKSDIKDFQLSVSMGFETKVNDSEDMQTIIKSAEDYMHRRKLIARAQNNRDSLSSIKATMMANSQETQDHMERMGSIALQVGDKLGLKQNTMDDLYLLALLHDIGKVGVPSNIINKPGKLTDEEWKIMRTHPSIGYQIAMSSIDLKSIAEGILSHHERFDGTGYPDGLKGKEIPLISRIISVIDTYDAITQDRPYRKARSHEEAILEIKKCSGTQFDPDIVEAFIGIFA